MIKYVLKLVLRLLFLPVLVVLSAMCVIVDMAERLFCWVAAPFYWFLFICMVLAVFNSQWLNLGILTAMFVGLVVLTLLVGFVGSIIEILRDDVQRLWSN